MFQDHKSSIKFIHSISFVSGSNSGVIKTNWELFSLPELPLLFHVKAQDGQHYDCRIMGIMLFTIG